MSEVHPLEPNPPDGLGKPEPIGRKRQRRPSVRLGDIGGEQGLLYDHPPRGGAGNKQCRAHNNQNHNLSDSDCKKDGTFKASSRARALTNLPVTLKEEKEFNLDAVASGSWKVRDTKRRVASLPTATRRVRSNWGKDSKFDDTEGNNSLEDWEGRDNVGDGRDDMAEEEEDEYSGRRFNVESPVEEEGNGNEVHCSGRKGGEFSRLDEMDLSDPSDNDQRGHGNNNVGCSARGGVGEDAVRIWLDSIGLGRYAPVFEVHEVDDEVLPKLTLEDLKDMGISAVGSRRKMFCAIQKLGRGFS